MLFDGDDGSVVVVVGSVLFDGDDGRGDDDVDDSDDLYDVDDDMRMMMAMTVKRYINK